MNEGIETSLLVIILDTNPNQKLLRERPQILTQCMESIIAFSNAHLMLKSTNKIAVLASHTRTTQFLYPTPGLSASEQIATLRQQDGQYELFTYVEKTLRQGLQQMVLQDVEKIKGGSVSLSGDTLLAGAIAMALCYIHRLEIEAGTGTKMNARILVVTGSGDSSSQYMNYMNVFFTAQKQVFIYGDSSSQYMNVFFTAQKQNVVLDVCSLDQDLGLLQQGCDITSGLYLKVPQLHGLVQYLLWVFLPEPPIRNKLVLPPPVKVDYRAACFCHRELIDIGFVCSVCLSIFCKFSPICTTCHTVFKNPGPLPLKSKKKKIKLA